jgi:hypothetical protein
MKGLANLQGHAKSAHGTRNRYLAGCRCQVCDEAEYARRRTNVDGRSPRDEYLAEPPKRLTWRCPECGQLRPLAGCFTDLDGNPLPSPCRVVGPAGVIEQVRQVKEPRASRRGPRYEKNPRGREEAAA